MKASLWIPVILLGFISSMLAQPTPTPTPFPPLPLNIETFTVKTSSKENQEIPFYVRVPQGYDRTAKGRTYRLLFVCPHYNQDGREVILNSDLLPVADERNWFVVSPTFMQTGAEVRDRKLSYYYPESFSGKAVLEALGQISKKYPVDTEKLLMQGLSAGAQFVHRFALWAPERVTAVAVNSSSWFDPPNEKSNLVAWLVTIGEADPSYNHSLEFVDQLRSKGAAPLFRSYIGMIHEGDARANTLNAEFLKFYDNLTKSSLGKKRTLAETLHPAPALAGKDMSFIGDSQDWKYLENSEDNRQEIPEDTRIYLPSEVIAKLWGKVEEE